MVKLYNSKKAAAATAHLFTNKDKPDYKAAGLDKKQAELANKLKDLKKPIVSFYIGDQTLLVQFLDKKGDQNQVLESARKAGAILASELKSHKITDITLSSDSTDLLLAYAEGLAL